MAKQLPVVGAGFLRAFEKLVAANAVGDPATCKLEDFPAFERMIWPNRVKKQVKDGLLRPLLDDDGTVIAYEQTGKAMGARNEFSVPVAAPIAVLDRSESSITAHEMTAYAGRHFAGGKSRTRGLSETKRKERKYPDRSLTEAEIVAGKRLPTGTPPLEDHVERVIAKVDTFHTQRHTNNPLLMEKVRKQFALMDTAAVALARVQ